MGKGYLQVTRDGVSSDLPRHRLSVKVLILPRMALSHMRSLHGITIDYWTRSNNLSKI